MSTLNTYPLITPFLWFNGNAEEAVEFYVSVFPNSKVLGKNMLNGKVLTIAYELDGQKFTALNGGPMFQFTEAVSFVIRCADQKDVDYYWEKLTTNGGAESHCGWCKDKFGVSWQVVPAALPDLIQNPKAAMAMGGMKKLDVAKLEDAARA